MRVPPKTNTLGFRFQHLNLGGTQSVCSSRKSPSNENKRGPGIRPSVNGAPTVPCRAASGGGLILGAAHSLPVKRGHPPHSVTAARTLPAHGEDNTLLRDETAARTERGNAGSTAHRSCHTQAPSPQRFSSPESLFSGSQCPCKPVLISLHPTLRNQEKSHGTKVMTGTVARSLSTGIAKLNQRQVQR